MWKNNNLKTRVNKNENDSNIQQHVKIQAEYHWRKRRHVSCKWKVCLGWTLHNNEREALHHYNLMKSHKVFILHVSWLLVWTAASRFTSGTRFFVFVYSRWKMAVGLRSVAAACWPLMYRHVDSGTFQCLITAAFIDHRHFRTTHV